jgi:hypothetical protein
MTFFRYVIVLPILFGAAAAHAEIYACAGKAKETTYQNFPCQLDSIGSLPTKAPPPAPPVDLVKVVATAAPPLPSEPRNGMRKDEVRAIWGEPSSTHSHSEEDGLAERSETWIYGESREVQFIDNRVFAVRNR